MVQDLEVESPARAVGTDQAVDLPRLARAVVDTDQAVDLPKVARAVMDMDQVVDLPRVARVVMDMDQVVDLGRSLRSSMSLESAALPLHSATLMRNHSIQYFHLQFISLTIHNTRSNR